MSEKIYTIKETLDKGKGMFALRSIHCGMCILSESPIVYVGKTTSLTNSQAVHALSETNRKVFFALHNAFPDDPHHHQHPTASGIIRTNALPLSRVSTEGAVYPTISRINHSCSPNVVHLWNPVTMKGYINAVKDIPPGSEILLNYMPLQLKNTNRRAVLQEGFRFTCWCELCSISYREEAYKAAMNAAAAFLNDQAYPTTMTTTVVAAAASSRTVVHDPVRSLSYLREALAQAKKRPCYFDGYQNHPLYCDIGLAKDLTGLLPDVETCCMTTTMTTTTAMMTMTTTTMDEKETVADPCEQPSRKLYSNPSTSHEQQ